MTPTKALILCFSLAGCETILSFSTKVSRATSSSSTTNPTIDESQRVSCWSTTRPTWPLSAAKSDDFAGEGSKKLSRGGGGGEDNKPDDKDVSGRFAKREELKRLRADLDSLRENLSWAQAMEDQDRIEDLTKAIKNGENRDPDIVYRRALRSVIDAKASFKLSEDEKQRRVKKWQKEAAAARRQLPRFQLEGLWVGSYGDQGLEMINVTYTGDTLVSTKVTGDDNVPRGQTSFTADLSPSNASSLEPLKVSFDREATQLLRYPGKGQIAKKGFTDKKFVEGQLVMFDKHFSFVWIPTRHHVLFRRPTPEQTLSLLRDVIAKEDEVQNMRDHLTRCLDMDMTDSLARFHANKGSEPFRRIKLNTELREMENEFQSQHCLSDKSQSFNFLHIHKWRAYIDRVLGEAKD